MRGGGCPPSRGLCGALSVRISKRAKDCWLHSWGILYDDSSFCSKVFIERARLAHLAWGVEQHILALQKQYPGGFDVILGADVVYVEDFIPQLFNAAKALISPCNEASLLSMCDRKSKAALSFWEDPASPTIQFPSAFNLLCCLNYSVLTG